MVSHGRLRQTFPGQQCGMWNIGWNWEEEWRTYRRAFGRPWKVTTERIAFRRQDWAIGWRKMVESGTGVPRFIDRDEKASEDVEEQQARVAELVEQLTKDIPVDPKKRSKEQQGRWLLAQLLDWHRRDAKPKAWRYFDLRGMDDADLMEERDAVSGLVWMGSVTSANGSIADRYSF